MNPRSGRLGVFPLDPGRLGGAVAHPVIPSSFSLTDLAPVALWATNDRGDCVAMAGAWERFTGRPPEAAAGDGWLGFVHDDDRVALKSAHLSAAARRERFEAEARFRRSDGSWHLVRVVGAPQLSGGVFQGFTGCAFDASRIREERDQHTRERRALGRLADLSFDGLVVVDPRGRIERANPAAVRMLGGEGRTGLTGESLDLIVPGWRSLPTDAGSAPLVEVTRLDGTTLTARGRAELLPDPMGDRTVVAIARMEGMAASEDRRGMPGGRGAADLLHELSNVVTALLAGCELLRETAAEGRVDASDIDLVENSVRQVRELTQALKPPERGRGDPDAGASTSASRLRPTTPSPAGPAPSLRAPSRPTPRRRRETERPEETLSGLTVLVVDDDLAIRRSVRAALEAAGATVHDARQGADALLMWSDLRGRVDLVITDLRMPEMGGEELAERLRMLRRDLPILFVSGYALDRRVRRRPGDGFLAKPFGRDDLLKAAGAVVRQPGAGV